MYAEYSNNIKSWILWLSYYHSSHWCWLICNAAQTCLSYSGDFTAIPWDESMLYDYFSLVSSSVSRNATGLGTLL